MVAYSIGSYSAQSPVRERERLAERCGRALVVAALDADGGDALERDGGAVRVREPARELERFRVVRLGQVEVSLREGDVAEVVRRGRVADAVAATLRQL